MLRALLVVLVLGLTFTSGCATVASSLPAVIAAVTDGVMVLDSIADFASRYFDNKSATDPKMAAKVEAAINRARAALNFALRACQGAEKLSQEQVDEAFAEFRRAYADLLALIEPLGVRAAAPGAGLRATAVGLAVPEPLALAIRVK
jgi:hypothetical protein